jgi:outer membrane protein insertion porin family
MCCLLAGALNPGASLAAEGQEAGAVGRNTGAVHDEKSPANHPYTVTISGNSHFSEKDLLDDAASELQMFEQRGYRKADIDDAAYQMRSAYLQAGFAFAFVDYTYEKKDNVIHVAFTVDEGPRVILGHITFEGNEHVLQETLASFFQKTDNGWGGKEEKVFVESEIKDNVSKIRDYYRGEGFADVVVDRPVQSFNEDRTGVSIVIYIEEGPRYIIDEVAFDGDLIPDLNPELESIKSDLLGKPYYAKRKLFLRASLKEAYDNIGYAEAEFDVKAVQQDKGSVIILQAVINKGEQARISEILISGNTSTRESFIRHRLQFKEGDIYTNAKRMASFRKLYDSGLFKSITMELSPPREDGSRILEVKIYELPTKDIYFELGWGSYEQLRARAGVIERNIFGTGRRMRVDGLVSTKGEAITLSYTDPWLLQTDITMNVPLSYERREEPSFTSKETAFSAFFSKKIRRALTLSSGYQYKITEVSDLDEDEELLQESRNDYNKGTVGIQAVWDTRDDIFYPADGLRVASAFSLSLPALGSDLEFGRVTLGCRYFIELPKSYILGLRATTGLIIPIRDQSFIPISERFFNGGDNTVRSYGHSELGPKDSSNQPTGGLGYNVFSVELRKRIYKNFAATLFVDAGNVSPNRSLLERDFDPYNDRSELMDDTLKDFFSQFKYGIGLGLQYLLPVGPARIDIAYNPDPEEIWDEKSWVFHFSLGMAF